VQTELEWLDNVDLLVLDNRSSLRAVIHAESPLCSRPSFALCTYDPQNKDMAGTSPAIEPIAIGGALFT